ncbi:MAG: peptidylprolyl isomerase [Chthoniobacterales bacterium]
MIRPFPLFRVALTLVLGAQVASGLTIKPNVAPVVRSAITDSSLYLQTTSILDLSPYFRDPDASAAVQLSTPSGSMKLTLDGETAPGTVANFLRYLDEGRYYRFDPIANATASVFFHRSVPGFIIQTGGFIGTLTSSGNLQPTAVATLPPIQNEPFISNVRGTIAMAKIGGDPNSATSQWFVNLADNSANLDAQNGGFTVFGRVSPDTMQVADTIASLPTVNVGSPFDSLPVRNYSSPNPVRLENLVSEPSISRISPFTFTASSANPTVATAATSGTNLLITGNQIGSAQITVVATDLDGASVSQSFHVNVTAAPGRMRNISTRVNFPQGDEVLIAGFIMRGGTDKRLVVRAIGPSLAGAGLGNPISDPALELRDGNGALLASNDDFASDPNQQLLTDLHFAPTDPRESALLVTVPSNATNALYSAIVRSKNNAPGIGLVEVYDLDSEAGSVLLNLSTRGAVGTGNNVMIGGFITQGTDSRRLLVRALGPSLSQAGVPDALPDPTLELRDSQGTLVDSNNDWTTSPDAVEIQNTGFAPGDGHESVVVRTLPSGAYTAIVAGAGNQPTGTALMEIYQVQ